MQNIPTVKLGIISVSRDCFPIELSASRRAAVAKAAGDIYECKITVENEADMLKAVEDVNRAGVNALVVFLGNFGPETPETLIAQKFCGPTMFIAAAEDSADTLINGRGDAYCGMLNCSYNLGLRNIKAFIPEYPVGTPEEVAGMIADFVPVARALIGIKKLKILTYGPRPQDFMACNAPIKALFDLGVEIMENSELDLLVAYKARENDPRIPAVIADMEKELGGGGKMSGILPKLAQFELTLLDLAEQNKGAREYIAFANKCWPAFQTEFGFVPCYVNSRLTARGIPVSCEVDIYGTLSEYIGICVSGEPVTLLDINNTVPVDMYESDIKGKFDYKLSDVFMGFHCGNTPMCKLSKGELKHQLIMYRLLEPGKEPNITRGTLEGDIIPGKMTFFRLQGTAGGGLRSYIAQGEVLPVATRSFGGIGVVAIKEMGRFYRHVLIAGQYPHHGAVAFGHVGKKLFDVFAFLGVPEISYNRPAALPYPTENPFA
ncbi:MAG: fucose isomerase [Oscillospiraceae bacterium]|nr:fucose isomerase [Oscillospiraceae bacterium]